MRKLEGKYNGYALRARQAKLSSAGAGLRTPADDAARLQLSVATEVETLRLRQRTLTTTNTNLRRRVKELEAQLLKSS